MTNYCFFVLKLSLISVLLYNYVYTVSLLLQLSPILGSSLCYQRMRLLCPFITGKGLWVTPHSGWGSRWLVTLHSGWGSRRLVTPHSGWCSRRLVTPHSGWCSRRLVTPHSGWCSRRLVTPHSGWGSRRLANDCCWNKFIVSRSHSIHFISQSKQRWFQMIPYQVFLVWIQLSAYLSLRLVSGCLLIETFGLRSRLTNRVASKVG